jgi:hypothetical protein
MKNSPEILNELKEISPLLAGLEKVNLFQVPESYFDELHFRIAEYVKINDTPAVDNIIKRNLQQVPEGYFDTLSDSILAKVKAAYPESAEEELQKLSPVLYSLRKKNVFSVPQGYFESFAEEMTGKVKLGYSENAEDELRQLSPMLYALKGENIFSVPRNYFDFLAGDIVEKVKPQPAKIITLKKRNSWLKYAAAAVVTGVIAVSSLQIFNNSSDTVKNKGNITASTSLTDYIKASFQYKTEDELNAGIAKLDDDDIAKYLENNGSILDNEMLINNTDVSEMPSQADYLTDENALNKYLNKIDTETEKKSKL